MEKVATVPVLSKDAKDGIYLLIGCIDYRFQCELTTFMEARGLKNRYDQLTLPGSALAALNPNNEAWKEVFLEQLELVVRLHSISTIIILDHRDCGMYKTIYGKTYIQDGDQELELHTQSLKKLRSIIHNLYPEIEVELLLMNVDGSVEIIESAQKGSIVTNL